ncbi:MAG TPA: glycosyltransferase [Chthoniobacteraceae bacterium]
MQITPSINDRSIPRSLKAAVIWPTEAKPAAAPAKPLLDWEAELEGWPALEWPEEPIRAPAPTARHLLRIRVLMGVGIVALVSFLFWLYGVPRRGDAWLFWPLAIAMTYRALWWVLEWTNFARPRVEPLAPVQREWKVDVLTTACPGEPRGMILRTLRAMQAMRYPHTSYLCDEGNDPVLREACRQLGVVHVTREIKTHAKAGNINNALAQCTGEIAIILDPDHEPAPYMIERVLGYFEDSTVGFVQSVQAYRNQKDSFVADGAAKQTYLFYGPMMMGMNAYGTTQAIGANCVFRRAALDSIGGHATGLAEDMHTTMLLYAKGWRSIYVPEILTRGLVPSTLSAYCKQQLKWACGSFELLLHGYAKMVKGFTIWQAVHYVFAPLYFLRGFVSAISIVVPIIALFFGGIPLRVDLLLYLAMYAPVLVIATAIRQVSQHWAVEEQERGAHLIGGILGAGCWFVFMQGVLCAIFRIKLPYLPTPKGDDPEDCWPLAAPNLVAAALSFAAAIYGAVTDWNPFTMLMIIFALWNAIQLTFVASLALQLTVHKLTWFFVQRDWAGKTFGLIERARFAVHTTTLRLVRERPMVTALPVIIAGVVLSFWPKAGVPHDMGSDRFKDTGGFYAGMHFAEADDGVFPASFKAEAAKLGMDFRLFPMVQKWGPESLTNFPTAALRTARLQGAVPLITWEPWTNTFTQFPATSELARNRHVCAGILHGAFDAYLVEYARRLRDFGDPVMIRFAPLADHPNSPWSEAGGNSPQEFVDAWIYVCGIFNRVGAANVGWIWQGATPEAIDTHFPGKDYVDWIGVTALDTDRTRGARFAELYQPFREKLLAYKLPVLIASFGTVAPGAQRAAWLQSAFTSIVRDFPEIRGLVLSGKKNGWFADESAATTKALARGLAHPAFRAAPKRIDPPAAQLWAEKPRATYRSQHIAGKPGDFKLMVENEPFYIRGVAYNPGHDWRDGNIPLTRRELHSDLTNLKAMGANTIRRYGSGWYDRNIFRVAHQKDLKVLYGFWFEHHVDYVTNTRKRAAYEAEVVRTVTSRRDEPNILAWSLGNEVWGLLKHHYAQPYLTEVRHAHIDFVEHLARRVHEIDPKHPVFTAHEHSPHLAGALSDYRRGAPSIDFTAVNSYYDSRISELHKIAGEFDPDRPYLVSEFGTDGYWDAKLSPRTPAGALIEPTTSSKAELYARNWTIHTAAHAGQNIGGVAYCWRDRYEATATWFGLTDSDGRPKPSYTALQRLWTGQSSVEGPRITAVKGPDGPLEPGATFEVSAAVEGGAGKPLTYEWQLATDDFEMEIGRIVPSGDGSSARVTLPKKPGTYRLYVNVSGGSAADVANLPITAGTPAAITAAGPRRDWLVRIVSRSP